MTNELLAVELPSENPDNLFRTQIGNKLVSTVFLGPEVKSMDLAISSFGDIFAGLDEDLDRRTELLASDGDYETMVFNCTDDGDIEDWTEIMGRRYLTAKEAEIGHYQFVDSYLG